MKDKNKRRISILVTAQTAYNLRRLADLAGYHEPGMMVDKLVRDRLNLIRPEQVVKDACNSCAFIVRCNQDPSFRPPSFARCMDGKSKYHNQKTK